VKLNEIVGLPTANLFERLPLNGQVGETTRNGYGLAYAGDKVPIRTDEGVETRTVAGTNTLAKVNVSHRKEFNFLNNVARGFVFQAHDNLNGNIDWTFSPSHAAPVLMKVEENNGRAEAFYRIADSAGQIIDPGSFGSLWTGIASSLFNCHDFTGVRMFYKRPDSLNAGCAGTLSGKNFGFAWANKSMEAGVLYLRTIFYTPLAVYSIKNACASGSPLLVTSAQVSSNFDEFVGLKHNVEATTLNDLFELVRQGKMCIRADNNDVKIWWNEDELYKELEQNYAANFNQQIEDNSDFQLCTAEGAQK